MSPLEPWHLLVAAALLLCLLAVRRWPGSARGLGQSVHLVKKPRPDRADPAALELGGPEADGETDRSRRRMARHSVDPGDHHGWRY